MEISIIIPAHNEEKRISGTLEDYGRFFSKKYKKNFEIIVVLNGCDDDTLGIVKKMQKKYIQIRYLEFKRAGKGFAITEGFKAAKGKFIGFVDADNSTDARAFNDLIEKINSYDGIIASRWLKESIVEPKQSILRRLASRTFNFLVRVFFNMNFRDTQTGAKLFKKEAVKKVLPKLGVTEWAFDVDLLYNMKINNFKVIEVKTVWKDKSGSKLKVAKTTIEMLLAILRLRLAHSGLKFIIRAYDLLPEAVKLHHRL